VTKSPSTTLHVATATNRTTNIASSDSQTTLLQVV